MKRRTQFDEWYTRHFSKYSREWQTHERGDLYTLNLLKAAFQAGKRAKGKGK